MHAISTVVDAIAQATGYRAWSRARHIAVALLVFMGIGLAGWGVVQQQRMALRSLQAELTQLEESLKSLSTSAPKAVTDAPDFTQTWPKRDDINAVVRFLGALATQHQMNLGQMTLSHTASSAQALGRVDIALSMNGSYASGKAMLSELLGRYSSLAVQSLTATPRSGDASRIDWVLALTLYVKD